MWRAQNALCRAGTPRTTVVVALTETAAKMAWNNVRFTPPADIYAQMNVR
jgi:hypothetical protein